MSNAWILKTRYGDAAAAMHRAAAISGKADHLFRAARLWLQDDHPRKALPLLEQLAARPSPKGSWLIALSNTHLMLDAMAPAAAAMERAADVTRKGEHYHRAAMLWRQVENTSKTIALLEICTGMPSVQQAWLIDLADILIETDREKEAAKVMARTSLRAASLPDRLRYRGAQLWLNLRRPERALPLLEQLFRRLRRGFQNWRLHPASICGHWFCFVFGLSNLGFVWRGDAQGNCAPGALHHINVWGIERRLIFRNDADRDDFIDRFGAVMAKNSYDGKIGHEKVFFRTADTRVAITTFLENNFRSNIIVTTQPMLKWRAPDTASIFEMHPLKRDQIVTFLISREPGLPNGSEFRGEEYVHACQAYLSKTLDDSPSKAGSSGKDDEHAIALKILSNPMDLAVVADMIARGEDPDRLGLRLHQYEVMAEDYRKRNQGKHFPIESFSEEVFQIRLGDRPEIPADRFRDELECMLDHKLVLRVIEKEQNGESRSWTFRHDKIMEFFIVQAFTGENKSRQKEFFGDPRFKGVYLLLANLMSPEDAHNLREKLIIYAAETGDHSVSDDFIKLLRMR